MFEFLRTFASAFRRDDDPADTEVWLKDLSIENGVAQVTGSRMMVVTQEDVPEGKMPDLHVDGDLALHVWSPLAMPVNLSVTGNLRLIVARPKDGPVDTRISIGGTFDILDCEIALPPHVEVGCFVVAWSKRVEDVVLAGPASGVLVGKGFHLYGPALERRPDDYLVDEFPRPEVLSSFGLRAQGASRLLVSTSFVAGYLELTRRIPPRRTRLSDRIGRGDPSIRPVAPDPRWLDGRFDR